MNTWSDDPTRPSLTPSGGFPPISSQSSNMPPNGLPPSGGLPPYGPPPTGMPSGGPLPGGSPFFYRYHPALLVILTGLYFLALFVLCPASGAFAQTPTGTLLVGAYISLILGTIVCVLILDWRGFFSVRGLVPWRWPIIARLLLAVVALALFPLTLAIYFIRALLGLRRPPAPLEIPVPGMPPQRRASTRTMIGLASGFLITACLLISSIGVAANGTAPISPTPTSGQVVQNSEHPTATPTRTHKPTATPKPSATPTTTPTATPTATNTPRPTPTNTPLPQPTATNTPAPSCPYGAVNNNPWCYNFQCCNTISSPPGNFCAYFNCIASFWNGNGYVEECLDGTYSKSGGISGSCSHHGGNLQALLQP